MGEYNGPKECPYRIDFLSVNTYITDIPKDIILNKIKKLLVINKIQITGNKWELICKYTNSKKYLVFCILIYKYKDNKLLIELSRNDGDRIYMIEFNSYFKKYLNLNYFLKINFDEDCDKDVDEDCDKKNNNIIDLHFFLFLLTKTKKKEYLSINKYRNIRCLLTRYISIELYDPEKTNIWKPLPLLTNI